MALMRWDPFTEIESMRRVMDRLVDQVMPSHSHGRGISHLPELASGRALSPNLEVYTTDKEVVVSAELPGLNPADVTIEITDEAIHLSGEMKREDEIKDDNYYRSERVYGHFERVIPLPNRIKDTEAKASFKNGVLCIRAPLAEEVKKPQARRLEISSES